MAETNANIRVGVDTSDALAQLKGLQRQISVFHTQLASSGKAVAEQSARMQSSLMKNINQTGAFTAQMTTIKTGTESFTNALEKNKLSMGQYFRFAGASTKSFGKLFKGEFNTIQRVAEERVKDLQTQYIKLGRDASGAMKAIKVRPATLDMQNFGTQAAIAAQKTQLLSQILKQGTTNLLNWGKNTQWAGRQLMVGFTVPLTIFGGIAIREFQKIEEQAIKFKRVYGDMFTSTKETEAALDNIRALASEFTKFGIAVEKTVDLAAKVAQMGNVGAALETQVVQATRLSVLGGMEQMDALDTTISLTNAFKVEIDDLAESVNFLNAAENQTILAIDDFNTAIPLAGSVVKQLGGDVKDLAVLLTAMREGGINASQAGNALKSSLARLIAPSRNATETLGGFGIDVMGIVNKNAGDLMGTINVLAHSLNELDPLSRARGIEALFGKFQFARMSTLFSNIVDGGSQASKVLELTTNSAEELAILADRELGRVEESAATKFQKSVQQIQAALAPIGEAFLEVVVPILNVVKDVVERFSNMGDLGKKVFVGLVAVMGIVAPAVLMIVGLMANGAANMMKFGQVLANVFRKATGSTKILTEQTDYMNSEQIEAASIAASLNQVHNDLIQTFTGEAAAVELLVKAYDKAIARQRLMMQGKAVGAPGAAPTKATGFAKGTTSVPGYASGTMSVRKYAGGTVSVPRLYAKGIFSVPGPKGKGDIVPAMLSPGEAVIPTKVAQKYSPLIAGIIADNIPGFNRGTTGVQAGHLTTAMNRNDPVVQQRLLAAGVSQADIANPNVNFLSDLTMDMPGWINQQLRESANGVDPDLWLQAMGVDQLPGAMRETLKSALGEAGEDVNKAADDIQEKIVKRAAAKAKKAGKTVDDETVDSATSEVLAEEKTAGRRRGETQQQAELRQRSAAALEEKALTPVVARSKFDSADEELKKKIKSGEAVLTSGGEVYTVDGLKIGRLGGRSSDQGRKDFEAAKPGLKTRRQNVGGVERNIIDLEDLPESTKLKATEDTIQGTRGTYKGRKKIELDEKQTKDQEALNQQNKKSSQTAAKTAQTTAKAAKAKADADTENAKTTKKDTEATKQKTEASKQSAKASQSSAQKKPRELSQDPKNIRARERRAEKKAQQAQPDSPQEAAQKKARQNVIKNKQKQLQQETALLNQQAKVSAASGQEVKKQSIVARLQERMLQRKQARLAKEQALAVQETAVNTMPSGRGVRMGAAGAGMGVSGLMMAASMAPGAIGETAGKLMMPMMALSMVIPLMKNKFMAVIVVIGALIAAFMFVKDSFNKAAKEAADLALSLGAGNKALNAFAEQAGKVTATEIMDRRRSSGGETFNVQPGKTTFGEAFMAGDLGEEFVANLSKSLESGGVAAVQSQLINQLSTAVTTGALTSGQARSLVAEVSKELGDASFGIEVNSRLISLLGPDGENLLEDPLDVRVRLIEESRQRIRDEAGPVTERVNSKLLEGGGTGALAAGAGALAGAGLGKLVAPMVAGIAARAGVGAAAGAVAGPAAPLVSAVGAVVGTVVGLSFAVKDVNQAFKDAAAAAGQVTAFGVIALQQQQQLLDSLQLDFEKRIQSARAAGDMVEASRLENELIESRIALLQENQETVDTIMASFTGAGIMAQNAMRTSMDELLKDMGGSALEKMAIQGTVDAIDEAFKPFMGMFGGDAEMEARLKFVLLSEQVSAGELLNLINTFGEDDKVLNAALQVITNLGTADGNRALQVMNLFEEPEQRAQFILNVEANDSPNAAQYVSLFEEISKVGNVANLDIVLDFYLQDPSRANRLNEDLNRIRAIAAEGPTEISAFLNVFDDPEAQQALLDFSDEFAKLDPVQQVLYIQTFRTINETITDEQLQTFRGSEGTARSTRGDAASFAADRLVRARGASAGIDSDDPVEDISGSGQKASSVLDDLLKRLRNVRKLQIDLTAGWVESSNKINELFGGGRSIDAFSGLEQQMRAVGAQEDLITMIAGMPPEEFERAKKQLFNFDGSGNIVSMTNNLRNMGEAFKAIALGDFHNEQQRVTRNINEQIVAMRKLTAAGLSTSQAYQAVQNAAFASAVAHEKNAGVIKNLVKVTKEAKEMTEAFAAAQAVASKSQEVANLRNAASFAKINFGALSEAQKNLVLTDTNIQALIRTNVDPAALRQALKDAEEKAKLELEIKKLTFDGRVEIFESGFNKAMEKFRVLETEVKLRFEAEKEPYLKAIKQAEQEIADIRSRVGGLGDLEADLERIGFQEREINKAYDERIKALDKVEKANSDISRQAKGQLDIADALSRGDIAAAARSVQETRSQAAEAATKARRDRLEEARATQLAKLVGNAGLNREIIEERIFNLQKEIFNIEQQRIVPNQRQVELIERTEKALIEGLTVLGRTKNEWEEIRSRVDIAKVSTDEFTQAMENALDIVEDIVNYWDQFDDSPKDLLITEKTVRVTEEEFEGDVPVTEIATGSGGGASPKPVVGPEPLPRPAPLPFTESPMAIEGAALPEGEPKFNLGEWFSNLWSKFDFAGWFASFLEQPWVKSIMAMAIGTYNIFIKPIVDGLVEGWNEMVAKLKEAWETTKQFFLDTWSTVSTWFDQNVIQPIKNAWNTVVAWVDQNVVQPVKRLWAAVTSWFDQNIIQPIKDAWASISSWFDQNVIQPVRDAWNSVAGWVDEKVIQPIRQGWSDFTSWFFRDDTLENKIADVEQFWQNLIDNVVENFQKIVDWFKELPGKIATFVKEDIPRLMDQGIRFMLRRLAAIVNFFVALPEKIKTFVTETIPELWNQAVEKSKEFLENTVNWFKELPGKVETFITQDIPNFFSELTTKVATFITQDIPNFFSELATKAGTFLEPVFGWFSGLPGRVSNFFTTTIPNYFTELTTKAKTFLDPIFNWFSELPEKIYAFITETIPEFFGEMVENAIEGLTGIAEWFENLGELIFPYLQELALYFWDHLSPEAQAALEGVYTWFATLPERIRNFITVTIPEYFRNSTAGIVQRVGAIIDWFRELPNKIRTFITETIPNFFSELRERALERISAIFNWFVELPGRISNFITQTIPNLFRTLATTGLGHLARIFNWFRDLPGHVSGWFSNIGTIIRTSVIGAINGAIRAMRGFRLSMPSSVLGIPLPRGVANAGFSPFSGLQELRFNAGGVVPGFGNQDTIPAMLTPGEFVINKDSVQKYGIELLKMLNEGNLNLNKLSTPTFDTSGLGPAEVGISGSTKPGSSVYNNSYTVSVNVRSDADANQIARTVIDQIKTIDSQRVRGNRF